MASTKDEIQQKTVSDVGSANVRSSDTIYNFSGASKPRRLIPFIVEFVTGDGKNTTVPSGNGDEQILGVKFMINPASISINMAKIINRTQSLTAWVEEHWGEELDTVTFQGNTAAFVLGGSTTHDTIRTSIIQRRGQKIAEDVSQALAVANLPQTPGTGDVVGLTTRHRRDSVSYREFKRFLEMLRSNGAIFEEDTGLVSDRLFIRIAYDYSSYLGYFESLDITEDANSPFKFTYTATFKSEKTMYNFRPKFVG